MTDLDVMERIRNILVNLLSVDPEVVTSESNLIVDLAVESIDFLDIAFQLEKEFSLKPVEPAAMFPAFLREEKNVFDGDTLAPHVRERLLSQYPFLSAKTLQKFETTKSFDAFFEVSVLADFVNANRIRAAA